MSESDDGKVVVYYDGACPSCREDRRRYEEMAGDNARDVVWCDITGRDDELRREGIDPERALRELHVRDPEGRVRSEIDAYRLLMARAPRLQLLGWFIGLPVVRPLLSKLYRWMVDRRLRRTGRG